MGRMDVDCWTGRSRPVWEIVVSMAVFVMMYLLVSFCDVLFFHTRCLG